jgi:hypothetical protein
LRRAFLERLQVIMAVVENDAGEGVIHAVVDVVAEFAVAHGLADDFRDGGRGGRAEGNGPARRESDVIFGNKPVQLAVDDLGQFAERLDESSYGAGKPPPMSSRFILV